MLIARGNVILGVVLLILFLAAIPIVLYISNLEEIEEIDNENNKKEYISSLLVAIKEYLPDCSDSSLVGNGECNENLNILQCDYDGGDCPTTSTSTTSTTTRTTCPDWTKV